MTLNRTLPLLALSTLLVGAALAGQGSGRERPSPEDRAAKREEHWTRLTRTLDSNTDGAITREEFLKDAKGFAKLDRNGDGVLGPDDRRDDRPAAREGEERAGQRGERARGRAKQGLDNADTDGDGQVTRAEWDSARGQHFARLDANGDGTVTKEEFLAGGPGNGPRQGRPGGKPEGKP